MNRRACSVDKQSNLLNHKAARLSVAPMMDWTDS